MLRKCANRSLIPIYRSRMIPVHAVRLISQLNGSFSIQIKKGPYNKPNDILFMQKAITAHEHIYKYKYRLYRIASNKIHNYYLEIYGMMQFSLYEFLIYLYKFSVFWERCFNNREIVFRRAQTSNNITNS